MNLQLIEWSLSAAFEFLKEMFASVGVGERAVQPRKIFSLQNYTNTILNQTLLGTRSFYLKLENDILPLEKSLSQDIWRIWTRNGDRLDAFWQELLRSLKGSLRSDQLLEIVVFWWIGFKLLRCTRLQFKHMGKTCFSSSDFHVAVDRVVWDLFRQLCHVVL